MSARRRLGQLPGLLPLSTPNCSACDHPLSWHFRDVTGTVRCMMIAHSVSDKGILGIPFQERCSCANYEKQASLPLPPPPPLPEGFKKVVREAFASAEVQKIFKRSKKPPVCEDLRASDHKRCTLLAKWITPKIRSKIQPGGMKVCGKHKHRYETFYQKCEPIK